jgi:hypothetical protein
MESFISTSCDITCVRNRRVGKRNTFADRMGSASLDSAVIGLSISSRKSKITGVKVDSLLTFISYDLGVLEPRDVP